MKTWKLFTGIEKKTKKIQKLSIKISTLPEKKVFVFKWTRKLPYRSGYSPHQKDKEFFFSGTSADYSPTPYCRLRGNWAAHGIVVCKQHERPRSPILVPSMWTSSPVKNRLRTSMITKREREWAGAGSSSRVPWLCALLLGKTIHVRMYLLQYWFSPR